LGFYLISDGEERLSPAFPQTLLYLLPGLFRTDQGTMLSDAVIVMSSLNLIAGEMDA